MGVCVCVCNCHSIVSHVIFFITITPNYDGLSEPATHVECNFPFGFLLICFVSSESPATDQSDQQCLQHEPVSEAWSTNTGEGPGTLSTSVFILFSFQFVSSLIFPKS